MHHIIEEVDVYLAVLHQARELLLSSRKEKPARKIAHDSSHAGRIHKKFQKSRRQTADKRPDSSQTPEAGRRSSKNLVVRITTPKTPPIVSHSEPTMPMSSSERKLVREIVNKVPAKHRTTFNRFAASRSAKSVRREPKPTTALSHPIRSNIVVIPAEQLRLERERSVKPAVVRPRVLGSGATGRLAFEALFSR